MKLLLDENLSYRLVLGNCSNARVLDVLCSHQPVITETMNRPGIGVVELG